MKTKIRKEQEIYFFDFEGSLDFQSVDRLRFLWSQKGLKKKKIIFNLKALFFVGSQGFSVFFETVEAVKKENILKICSASSEFEKFFYSKGMEAILFESEREAISSFDSSKKDFEKSFTQNEYLPAYEK